MANIVEIVVQAKDQASGSIDKIAVGLQAVGSIPDNIYPARGRKHSFAVMTILPIYLNSRQYLPRKGTETFCWSVIGIVLLSRFPTIFTPQGDGNIACCSASIRQIFAYSRQYLPRKGTETLIPASDEAPFYVNSRQYLPRKGTETIITFTPTTHMVSQPFPTIFTPQGDGNKSVGIFLSFPDPCNSRQYLPRKGTETENSLIFRVPHLDDSRQYLPRKGTETHLTVIN